MNFEIMHFGSIEDESKKHDIAKYVEEYTHGLHKETPQMLPIKYEEILNKHEAFVSVQKGEFAGLICAEQPIEWGGGLMSEVGTLLVKPEFRGHRHATELVKTMSEILCKQEVVPYVFCNPKSEPIFLGQGFVLAECIEIPSAAFSLCADCPNKPENGCCDSQLIYKKDGYED